MEVRWPAGRQPASVRAPPTPGFPCRAARCGAAIGPEGGLDHRERDELIEGGFTPVSLVGNTLRFETAAIAALAIARSLLGKNPEEAPYDE